MTLEEYPKIIYYRHFSGGVVFPVYVDYIVAHRLQLGLIGLGKPQAFSDLLVAGVAISRGEDLATRDRDFEVIGEAAPGPRATSQSSNDVTPPSPTAQSR